MEEYRSLIIFGCVSLYMGLCIGVGIWAMRRTKSTKDFFMAGRDLGIMVTGLAIFSSTLSGFGFVGGPGLVYGLGSSSLWMIVCSTIGFSLSFHLLGKRLRLFAELKDSISLPDVVASRYNSELARFLMGLVIFLGVIGYLGAQISAMTVVLKNILDNVDFLPEVPLMGCMAISVAVLVFYCVTGGIVASVYTDLVQGGIMVIAALLVFYAAIGSFDKGTVDGSPGDVGDAAAVARAEAVALENEGKGGVTVVVDENMKDDREVISPWGASGMFLCITWYFIFGIGGAGQPHVITKMMMTKNIGDTKYVLPVSVIGYTVSALLWISIGFVIRTHVMQGTIGELGTPDDAAATFLQTFAHPLLAGVVFAGLFAAIMSTADGFLNVGAAAVVHDMPKAIIGRGLNNELLSARIATLLIAVGAALFTQYSPQELVALLGTFGWSTFAAATVPVVAIGFNWKRGTAAAANSAMIISLLIIFGFEISIKYAGYAIPHGINSGAIALMVSMTVFLGVSLASKQPELDEDIEAVMDL
jgi:Na+/proline symporter